MRRSKVGHAKPGERWKLLALERLQSLRAESRWVAAARRLERRHFLAHLHRGELRLSSQRQSEEPIHALRQMRARFVLETSRDSERASDRNAEAIPAPEIGPRLLDSRLQRYLERFLRFRLPAIQIHTGPAADRLARRYSADAVTSRDAIFFRHGAFDPPRREVSGFWRMKRRTSVGLMVLGSHH